MSVDSRQMLDLFGPVRSLLATDDLLSSAAAVSTLLVARCDEEQPSDWLRCACASLASLTEDNALVHALIAEPIPEPPYWRTQHGAVGGRAPRELLEAMDREVQAGCPSDDLAHGLQQREMWPKTASLRRTDMAAGERWATSGYRAWRRGLGLGEFYRVIAPIEDHLGRPRTLLIQFDGMTDEWKPDEHFAHAACAAAACVWSSYRDRFIAPLERAEQCFALLSPIRKRIARLIVAGKTESQIAEMIERSKHTVRDHVKAMYYLLEVGSRKELIERLTGVRRRSSGPALLPDERPAPTDEPALPELKPKPAPVVETPAAADRKARRKSASG